MNTKPITLKMHGIMDYALATTLLLAPPVLGLNKKVTNIYRGMAANLMVYNAMTDYSAGIKPVISLQTHKKVDYANIALFAIAGLLKPVMKDKKALAFHAGVTVMAAANVLLTDWDSVQL
jgi:hypothetical protein